MAHKNPTPTVDVILQKGERILLVRRKKDPFAMQFALPGGFINEGETAEQAGKREIQEETGLDVEIIYLLGVYSDPKRDPRGHILSVVFVGTIVSGKEKAGDDASDIDWIDLNDIQAKNLAFDHNMILQDYKQWRNDGGTFWSTKRR